jgi:ubiquitin C-terminal hydrolase
MQVLHNALRLNVKITINEGLGDSTGFQQVRKGFHQYEAHLKHDGYSHLDHIFGSQFESRLVCERCGYSWSTFDPYTLIPVEIGPRAITLYDCLDQFMDAELMEDVECGRCSKEHGKTRCTKQFRLWTLPLVLIVQLKRFDLAMRKISQFVQVPRSLNLSKYASHPKVVSQVQHNPAALQLFDLAGIGGHYTAKCRFSAGSNSTWFEFNDETVTRLSDQNLDQTLQSPLNYILFYEMTSHTRAFWNK